MLAVALKSVTCLYAPLLQAPLSLRKASRGKIEFLRELTSLVHADCCLLRVAPALAHNHRSRWSRRNSTKRSTHPPGRTRVSGSSRVIILTKASKHRYFAKAIHRPAGAEPPNLARTA